MIVPAIVAVPVEILKISFRPRVVALIVREPALNVPAPTAIVAVRPVDGLGMLTRPVTASEFVPLMFTALFVVTAAKVSVLAAAAISIVTVIPLLIVTVSAEVGTDNPPHVAVLLQLPETEATLAAAMAVFAPPKKRITAQSIAKENALIFFFIPSGSG